MAVRQVRAAGDDHTLGDTAAFLPGQPWLFWRCATGMVNQPLEPEMCERQWGGLGGMGVAREENIALYQAFAR
ncbi:hypothetical protein [Pseudomonas typographi]|uniref:Uncharacterized protein n=1 Tax=Pseudomonas typographi TaxID=2715964 RepID=A0ABR7Z626_9PSED|nr:hypothetical protein [Pseudomonas typographi]MBD1554287.1 hypothetical protein [Pseudomonas typographi]MBD1589516.1 hypothetical protein [Pseudomonas typographi]MBD1600897.1 hypothetical protein [Pseudomonas typographi]